MKQAGNVPMNRNKSQAFFRFSPRTIHPIDRDGLGSVKPRSGRKNRLLKPLTALLRWMFVERVKTAKIHPFGAISPEGKTGGTKT